MSEWGLFLPGAPRYELTVPTLHLNVGRYRQRSAIARDGFVNGDRKVTPFAMASCRSGSVGALACLQAGRDAPVQLDTTERSGGMHARGCTDHVPQPRMTDRPPRNRDRASSTQLVEPQRPLFLIIGIDCSEMSCYCTSRCGLKHLRVVLLSDGAQCNQHLAVPGLVGCLGK